MTTRKLAVLTTGVLAAAAFATLSGTAWAAPDEDVVTSADLDGDGEQETVNVLSVGTQDQRILAVVDGVEVEVAAPADTRSVIRPPRVVDIDGDGSDELVVREQVGANTEAFGIWEYANGEFRAIGTPNADVMRLYQGGGVSARSGYGCEGAGDDRTLVVLSAEADVTNTPEATYSGSWTYYRVVDGIATPTGAEESFANEPADTPMLQLDADTCKVS